jgi:hypothetical protein
MVFAAVLFFFLLVVFTLVERKNDQQINGKYHAAAGRAVF